MPFFYFILCLAAIAVCLVAALYLAYRNSSKLRDMISVVLSPDENCTQDRNIPSIIRTFLWFLIIHISISVIYHFADLLIFGETIENSIENAFSFPLWVVLILPPILEETAFRLPLKRRRIYIALSATVVAFFLSASVFSTMVYEVTWPRLAVCAAIGGAVWIWGYKLVARINYKVWFWLLAAIFAVLHIINYDLSAMHAGEWLRVTLKEAVKIPSALMFSYARLRHGFAVTVLLHFITNFSMYILGTLL